MTTVRKFLPGMVIAITTLTFTSLGGCKMNTNCASHLPRNEELQLFKPHMASFDCKIEAEVLPRLDAQAEQWFQEARALESPEIYVSDRDYPRIVRLTQQAAERNHWKAMLNLASFYVEGRDPRYGREDAVRLVEAAMRMNVPAAYDRMGTYYMNGVGVRADATRAYAFWQKAALMGNPEAMTYLGEKLQAVSDGIIPGYWANIPIATRMLECALSQGHGRAAYELSGLYLNPAAPDGITINEATAETREHAVRVLHRGVMYGCSDCAAALYLEFDRAKPSNMIAPFIDKARSERYRILARALAFNPDLRFPNLDQILPLPPATIPTWNGDKKTLIDAAMGVSLPPAPVKAAPDPKGKDRHALDGAFELERGSAHTSELRAPFAGYWQPTAPSHPDAIQQQLARIRPGLYGKGEAFDTQYVVDNGRANPVGTLVWTHWLTVELDDRVGRPTATAGLTRTLGHAEALMQCAGAARCPATGIWQPWLDTGHPLHGTVNRSWRQSWVHRGEPFPDLRRDWLLDLSADAVTWHLMDTEGIDIGRDIDV